jgi:hypothetical protein
MTKRAGRVSWLVPFFCGSALTIAAGWVLLPVFADSTGVSRKGHPTEEQVKSELVRESLTRQAFDLKAKGDLDGALALMDQLIKEEGGGREFTVISWLMDAKRDAETLPYFRKIYGERLRSGQGISMLSLLYTYAEVAAEHGTEEDARIILDTMKANAPDELSKVQRILAERLQGKLSEL